MMQNDVGNKSAQCWMSIFLFIATFVVLSGCTTKNVTTATTSTETAGTHAPTALVEGSPKDGTMRQDGTMRPFSSSPEKPEKTELVGSETPSAVPSEGAPAEQALADVYFAFDRWALSIEGKKNLAQSAAFLKQHQDLVLLIEGHCDERGTREYNLVLGEKRAQEARQYLLDLGVPNTINTISYGKERPVCQELDESCYWRNRRAHLLVEHKR